MRDMETPLKKVRGLGAAREGTGGFWRQRVSGLALAVLTLFVVGWIWSLKGAGFAEVRASLAHPLVAIAMALFIVISLDHMRLGKARREGPQGVRPVRGPVMQRVRLE